MKKPTILIFEDSELKANELKLAIEKKLLQEQLPLVDTIIFKANKPSGPYDKQLYEHLIGKEFGDVQLIVTDRDLSGTSNWTGLSEVTISAVAERLGIPVCLYATGMNGDLNERTNEWKGQKFIMEDGSNSEIIGSKAVIAYKGFQSIRSKIDAMISKKLEYKLGISGFMAEILGQQKLINAFSSYSRGSYRSLSTLMDPVSEENNSRRLSTFLGLWLWDTILRFPGILVNKIAAASFLNLSPETFESNEIQDLITKCKYEGPFHELECFWWRSMIEEVYLSEGCDSFIDLIKIRYPKKKIIQSKCHVDSSINAGYYCIKNKLPVSKKNSTGSITWLPVGADLSRITNTDYDKLSPWLGL